jgi:DHA2 family multidrug resistance protein-like MFS transporter
VPTKELSLKAMLWIVSGGFFMQTLDTTIVNTALPAMARDLHELPLNMQPVIVAYSLTMAMLIPASGWLGDRFGTRRVYVASVFIFVLGSVCCAMSQSLNQLVAARVLQGVGGSMLLPIGRLAILRGYPSVLYLSAITTASIAGQVGPLLGPVLGGWLVEKTSWHWIFLINLPIGLIACIAALVFLSDERGSHPPSQFDLPGFALLSACMVTFSLALEGAGGAQELAWVTGMLAASVASALVYVYLARKSRMPLFPLALFTQPTFARGLAGNLITRVGMGAVPFLLPMLFQLELGFSPFESGLMLLPTAIAAVAVKRAIPALVRTHGYRRFLLANVWLVGASIIGFSAIGHASPIWLLVLQLSLFGAFNSMLSGAMNSVTLKDLEHHLVSSGNGLFSMTQMLAVALGVATGGTLVKFFSDTWSDPSLAFRLTFIVIGMVILASTTVFSSIRRPEVAATASQRVT